MGWNPDIDFVDANLDETAGIFHDIILAVNERCDAANIDRPFAVNTSQYAHPDGPYSGAITSITLTYTSWPATIFHRGNIVIIEGPNIEEFKYTAVSGTGTSRTFTVDHTLSSAFTTAANVKVYDIDEDELYLYPFAAITTKIDAKLTALIPLFADHTLATGNKFIGLTNVPAWSEATMLAAIGDISRINGTPLIPLMSWISQVYRIINNLLWVRHQASTASFYAGQGYKKFSSLEATWADVVASWPGLSWVSTEDSGKLLRSYGRKQIGGKPYIGQKFYTNYEYKTRTTATHNADLYLYTSKNVFTGASYKEYNDDGLNVTEDVYDVFISNSSQSLLTGSFDVKSELETSGAPPEPDPGYSTSSNGFAAHGDERSFGGDLPTPYRYAVLRFDVTGGFNYVA